MNDIGRRSLAKELKSLRAIELAALFARRGQSLVEVLVAAAVGALLVIAAAGVIAPALRANSTAGKAQVAAALGKELSDNIRVWSEGDWHNIANLATSSANLYYLNTSSSQFTAVTGTESVVVGTTTYTRYFYVDDVQRNAAGAVVSSGGSNDPSTKMITQAYNWPQGNTTTFSFHLSRYRNNVFGQTDWSGGSGHGTPVTSTKNLFASSTSNIKFLTPGSVGLSMGSTGTLASWLTTTVTPSAVAAKSAVVNNGYVYSIGGSVSGVSTSTVLYAQINTSTGAIGSWATTTALPDAIHDLSVAVSNGYVYVTGGAQSIYNNLRTSTVLYASINTNGTLGSWVTTTAMPSPLSSHGVVVYNGYIYTTGGVVSSTVVTSTVFYAPINATGTLGSWSTTEVLPGTLWAHGAVVNSGYVYTTGGTASGTITSTVLYAQVNTSTGAIGSWVETTALPNAIEHNYAVVNNGYIYVPGGLSMGSYTASVFYAPINANGTIGSWSTTNALPSAILGPSIVNNGYIYLIGGSPATSTVFYAPIN